MGMLGSLVRKVVGKVTGTETAPNTTTVRTVPKAAGAPVAARPASSAAAAPAHAAGKPAGKPADTPAPTLVRALDQVAVAGDEEPVVENAEALSTIEAGVQEVKERLDAGEPVTMLDVREPSETAGGVIPGAILIPLGQLRARWEEVKNANEIVCYCAMGARSLQAAHFLREQGLFNATSLDGGISAWMEVGGKVVRPSR